MSLVKLGNTILQKANGMSATESVVLAPWTGFTSSGGTYNFNGGNDGTFVLLFNNETDQYGVALTVEITGPAGYKSKTKIICKKGVSLTSELEADYNADGAHPLETATDSFGDGASYNVLQFGKESAPGVFTALAAGVYELFISAKGDLSKFRCLMIDSNGLRNEVAFDGSPEGQARLKYTSA